MLGQETFLEALNFIKCNTNVSMRQRGHTISLEPSADSDENFMGNHFFFSKHNNC